MAAARTEPPRTLSRRPAFDYCASCAAASAARRFARPRTITKNTGNYVTGGGIACRGN